TSHVSNRSGTFAPAHRGDKGPGKAAAAGGDWCGFVWPTGRLARAVRDRTGGGFVHDRRSGPELWCDAARPATRLAGGRDGDIVFSVETIGCLWRWRCVVY